MKNNCKGFVLLETLIVAVFIIGIFTFLYSSVVPLLGTYDNLTTRNSIDGVYKLYHLRKFLYKDDNYKNIVGNSNGYAKITCNDFSNSSRCNALISENNLDLGNNYELIYVKDIDTNKSKVMDIINDDTFKKYVNNYNDEYSNVILLYDSKNDIVSHLSLIIN